jgi:hypothetical protein
MYETQYVLLFVSGMALTVGAWKLNEDQGRGFAAVFGLFVWLVLGFASTAVVVRGGAGSEYVYSSQSLSWLCFGNATLHAVALVLHLHEMLTDADDDADLLDPDSGELPPELRRQIDEYG